jgi:chromosomal replication initiation ATPase DnaA
MQITIIDPARRLAADPDARTIRNWGGCPEAAHLSGRDLRRCRLIVDLVAARFQLTGRDIFHRRRTGRIAPPRQVAMTLMRQVLGLPLQTIGRLFDRDHGTVIYAAKAVASHAASSPEFAAIWDSLKAATYSISAS